MKFIAVLIFTTLLAGSECVNFESFGAEVVQETFQAFYNFMAPIRETQARMKTNYYTTGSIIRSADDCLKLTNTSEQAYALVVKTTEFGVAAVKEVGDAMNTLIGCSQEALVKQLKCVFTQLEVVRNKLIALQQQLQPYVNEGKILYYELVEELEECL